MLDSEVKKRISTVSKAYVELNDKLDVMQRGIRGDIARVEKQLTALYEKVGQKKENPYEKMSVYLELQAWREETAKEEDVAEYRIMRNRELEAIADAQPKTLEELWAVPKLRRWVVESFGEEIVAVVSGKMTFLTPVTYIKAKADAEVTLEVLQCVTMSLSRPW